MRGGFIGFQGSGIELLRGRIRGDEPAAAAAIALNGVAPAGVGDRVPDSVGQQFDGFDETDVFDLLDEGVDVAALATPETMEMTVVGADMKRRRLLIVERAQTFE